MKKSYLIAILIAVIAVFWVISGMFSGSPSESSQEIQTAKAEQKRAVQVRVRETSAEKFSNQIVVTGRTFADKNIELRAEIEGQVTEIVAEKGDMVEEGGSLAHIAERDRAARVAEAKERLSQREIEYNAAKKLESQGFNSKVRLAQSTADMELAKAELRKAEIDLDNTDIKAPFAGKVFEQMVEIGDYVSVGDVLFSLVDLSLVEVRGYVTERQVREVKLDASARVILIDGQQKEGKVTYIAPAADPQTRTFEVEISVPNEDYALIEGMTARILIEAEERLAHKISPSILVLDEAGRIGVKAVSAENKVEFYPVNIVADRDDSMIVNGLPDKVKLITVGQDFVIPGQVVEPVPAEGEGLL